MGRITMGLSPPIRSDGCRLVRALSYIGSRSTFVDLRTRFSIRIAQDFLIDSKSVRLVSWYDQLQASQP